MQFTDAGFKLLKEFEGCSLTAYQDQGGKWTLGYGHALGVKAGDTLPDEMAAALLLSQDVQELVPIVSKLVKSTLTDNQFSALVCFAFNVGTGNLSQSTLLNCINTGHIDHAPAEFTRWVKVNGIPNEGLMRRRLAERDLFLSLTQ
jgi:lysozyme